MEEQYNQPPQMPQQPVITPTRPVHSHRLLFILLGIVLTGVVVFVIGYTSGYFTKAVFPRPLPPLRNDPTTKMEVTQTPSLDPIQDKSVVDLKKNKVGDMIGSMEITRLGGYKASQATEDNAFIDFTGKVSVTGAVTYFKDGSWGGERVCMEVSDTDSLSNLPKLRTQTGNIFFCFTNLALAKQSLVTNLSKDIQRNATVSIAMYKIQRFPEAYNTAELISIAKDTDEGGLGQSCLGRTTKECAVGLTCQQAEGSAADAPGICIKK